MIKVEAATLQEAYSKAASELSCSVVDLDINVIQNGSSGFLGLFNVAFQRHHALGLHGLGQLEPQRQQVLVVLLLPLGAAEDLAEASRQRLSNLIERLDGWVRLFAAVTHLADGPGNPLADAG